MPNRDRDGGGTTPGALSPAPSAAGDRLELTAYYWSRDDIGIVPASRTREWMDATGNRFAYRCLPLLVANQSGWFLLNKDPFRATWDGGDPPTSVRIENLRDSSSPPAIVSSHFGHGIVTWHIPFLFRTPPGYNLLARGPANLPKDGAFALDGLVETDWSVASFTMNWKITRVGHPVTFDADEPFCMIVPQRRNDLEAFAPTIRPLAGNPALDAQHKQWNDSRKYFLGLLRVATKMGTLPDDTASWWQKHYFQGTSPGGAGAREHQTKRSLREFVREDGAPGTGDQR